MVEPAFQQTRITESPGFRFPEAPDLSSSLNGCGSATANNLSHLIAETYTETRCALSRCVGKLTTALFNDLQIQLRQPEGDLPGVGTSVDFFRFHGPTISQADLIQALPLAPAGETDRGEAPRTRFSEKARQPRGAMPLLPLAVERTQYHRQGVSPCLSSSYP